MSDDNKSSEGTTSQVEASEVKQIKQWTDDEVQKIISERDKTKSKLRNFEDGVKKIEEQKLIEDGKLKELLMQKETQLTDLQSKATKYDDEMKRLKEHSLNKIDNEDLRSIASRLESIDDIVKIGELTAKSQIKVENGKLPLKSAERKFKNFQEMEQYLKSQNLAV